MIYLDNAATTWPKPQQVVEACLPLESKAIIDELINGVYRDV